MPSAKSPKNLYSCCFPASILLLLLPVLLLSNKAKAQLQWPAISQQTKPWARWWWEGSAVNEKDLSQVMQLYKNAGLGGLEITPIYGVKGEEAHFIPFLSRRWMQVFDYTLQEGKKLNLGIDLANATGWPFGGPWVSAADESKSLEFKTYRLQKGHALDEPIVFVQQPLVRSDSKPLASLKEIKYPIALNSPDSLQRWALDQVRFPVRIPLVCLTAYNQQGKSTDLTRLVDKNGKLNWKPTDGDYQLYAVFQGMHGKMVERAAPGGEGFVIDHFSTTAVQHYLQHFDSAFNGHSLDGLRGFFNDSYEVDDAVGQADFTPAFFSEFQQRHGYDLKKYLPRLLNKKDTSETASRVLSDFRQTISDLLLEHFTQTWENWARAKNKTVRNQSHGSPANILDLYAAVDIPETEGTDKLRFKFATSAANVTGKPLASSESATWLKDHFLSSLSDVKSAIDLYFLGGVNHIFYHGVAYSPLNAPWPGWLFYAAVHFQLTNPQWDNFSTLNQYIANCQSFLQSSKADNDVLQYFPIFDSYAEKGRALLNHYDGMKGFEGTAFQQNAGWMMNNGYSFDFISDKQIQQLSFSNGKINSAGGAYQTILLSAVNHIPEETLAQIFSLAKAGAIILVYGHLPETVPGFGRLAERQKSFQSLIGSLHFSDTKNGVREATIGKGKVILADDLAILLSAGNIRRESISDHTSLQFIRRRFSQGDYYFIDNRGDTAFDGWINIQNNNANSFALFNPMNHQSGLAIVRGDKTNRLIYLQLLPGESCILQAGEQPLSAPKYPYVKMNGKPITINGKWNLKFDKGGPSIPASVTLDNPQFWTNLSDTNALNFSGTATYSIDFAKPEEQSKMWRLDLGVVKENAQVWLNGQKITTLLGPAYSIDIPDSLLKQNNHLSIRISNLMANRIRYMDRNGINYKRFYNINFPAHDAADRGTDGLFTAKDWKVMPSGLQGPVTLTVESAIR